MVRNVSDRARPIRQARSGMVWTVSHHERNRHLLKLFFYYLSKKYMDVHFIIMSLDEVLRKWLIGVFLLHLNQGGRSGLSLTGPVTLRSIPIRHNPDRHPDLNMKIFHHLFPKVWKLELYLQVSRCVFFQVLWNSGLYHDFFWLHLIIFQYESFFF